MDHSTKKKSAKKTLTTKEKKAIQDEVLALARELPTIKLPKNKKGQTTKSQFPNKDFNYTLLFGSIGSYVTARLLLNGSDLITTFINPKGFFSSVTHHCDFLDSFDIKQTEEPVVSNVTRSFPHILSKIPFSSKDIIIPPHDQMLQKRGIKQEISTYYAPLKTILRLFNDNQFETLYKIGLPLPFLNDEEPFTYYRQTIKMLNSHLNYELRLWYDYLRMLKTLNKDINNPAIYLPKDLKKAHNQALDKINKAQKKEYQKKLLEQDLINLKNIEPEIKKNFNARMQPFHDLKISNKEWLISCLTTINDHFQDAHKLHHCLFHCRYFEKKDTVILRITHADSPQSTYANAEVNYKTGEIRQIYGKLNSLLPPNENGTIKSLIMDNMSKFVAAGKKHKQKINLLCEEFIPDFAKNF